MTNPVIAEITRNGRVESRHRGAGIVMDAGGRTLLAFGDVDVPVFPRSSVKAMQALALVESGAADALGFADRELALACASHSGEAEHVAVVTRMLAMAGLGVGALECGPQWPSNRAAMAELARSGGAATPLYNSCSGKHAGFLAVARHLGCDHDGYARHDHPVQRLVRRIVAEVTGASLGDDMRGIDGCSAPTWAMPLSALARGFAGMASGAGLEAGRAQAAERLIRACVSEPFLVAGAGRACTRLMQAAPGRVFAKVGAEGVYCAALPPQGIAMALKCDDGAVRAVEALAAALLARFIGAGDGAGARLKEMANRPVTNRRGMETGTVRTVADPS